MSGYRGDGYGQYGNVGDDDFRWGEDDRRSEHGAARGNLMGRAEHEARDWLGWDGDDHRGREGSERLADDPRAVRAGEQWRERFGREGYQGSYAQHDETYRSYRERHLSELDNDYREYCQERGLEFGSAFDTWRRGRQAGGAVPAMAGVSGAPEGGFTDGATVGLNEGAGMSEGGAGTTDTSAVDEGSSSSRSRRGNRSQA